MKIKKRHIILFVAPSFLLFCLVFLIPLIMVFTTSFFQWRSGLELKFIGFKNFISGISDPNMIKAFINTTIWIILQSTVHVLIGVVLAFILSKKFKGWKIFRTVVMIPNVISMAALAVIFLNLFSPQIGLVNSTISAIIGKPFQWNWFFSVETSFLTVTLTWILYAGLISTLVLAGIFAVPIDLINSAKLDGATTWQINLKIIIPMIRHILGTCVIIAATSMLREFELIFLTTNGGPGNTTLNLPLYLYKTSLIDNNYGYANMMGVVLIVLGVLIVAGINKIFKMGEMDS